MLSIQYSPVPETVEDSFALLGDTQSALLCVADGCGGLGSRRYPELNNQTGASLAARLAVEAASGWWQRGTVMPHTRLQGQEMLAGLAPCLEQALNDFSRAHPQTGSRIVGSMQRELPTTLCMALSAPAEENRQELCFVWAGDSRGYVLDGRGLHQCTQDHVRGELNSFDSLYRDAPLSNLLSAGRTPRLAARHLCINRPGVVIVATDGAFGGLRTPMEMEMMLIDTLLAAKTQSGWQRKITTVLKKAANDDATLLMQPCGFETFEAMQRHFQIRRGFLQKQFITQARRKRTNLSYVEGRWQAYRQGYDWTEVSGDAACDWRI